jgi:hypothetical protein
MNYKSKIIPYRPKELHTVDTGRVYVRISQQKQTMAKRSPISGVQDDEDSDRMASFIICIFHKTHPLIIPWAGWK